MPLTEGSLTVAEDILFRPVETVNNKLWDASNWTKRIINTPTTDTKMHPLLLGSSIDTSTASKSLEILIKDVACFRAG